MIRRDILLPLMPGIDNLNIFLIVQIPRPCVIEVLPDFDASGRPGIPEILGGGFVIGQRHQFVIAERFPHRFDEFRIGGRVHGGHSLLAVGGIAIPEIHTVECVFRDNGLHLGYEIDNLGNVIAHHPGKAGEQKVLFAAHMDEPALMIYDVTERGFLRFKAVGTRVTPRQLSGRTVQVGENVMGVVGFAPYHMMRITDEQKRRSAENQHIDIAAESKERALERIQIGDYAVVDSPFVEMGENCKGRAMDSRLGCCAALELLREAPDKAFDVVFTTMYEVGQRGMEVAAYTQQPDLVVSIGAVPATDVPGSLNKEGRVELGQGVCMALTDAGFAYPRNTVEAWSKAAKEALGDVMDKTVEIKGVKLLAAKVDGVDMNALRDLGDQLKAKLGEGVVVLASVADGKVNLIAMATDEAMAKGAHAGNLIKGIAALVGGGGGGRPNMAQAGGKNPAGVDQAIAEVAKVLENQL